MRLNSAPIFAIGALALALGAVRAEAADRALVIGVNSYPFLTENGAPTNRDLAVAVQDATNFRAMLIDDWGMSAESIKLLTDADATHGGIIAAFDDWLVAGSEPGDRVVLYFSGHGFQSFDEGGDEDDQFDEGLAAHDAAGDLVEGRLANIVIDDEVGALIEKLAGRDIVVVVDACFSGTITRSAAVTPDGRDGPVRARTLSPRGPVRPSTRSIVSDPEAAARHKVSSRLLSVVADEGAKIEESGGSLLAFSATTSAQLAFEQSEIGGVFTNAFVEGLDNTGADFDGDGKVTAAELLTFVRKRSDEFCSGEPMCSDGAGLTPELVTERDNFTHVLAPPLFSALGTVEVEVAEVSPTVVEVSPTVVEVAPTVVEVAPTVVEVSPTVVEVAPVEGGAAEGEAGAAEGEPGAGAGEAGAGEGEAEAGEGGIAPVETAAALFTHENDYTIDLSIAPGPKVAYGQEVTITVSSAETGFLVLFDQGPDGTLRQVFPNEYSAAQAKDGLINAGGTISVPDPSYGFAFEATEVGQSTLIALVVDGSVDYGDLLAEHPDFDIIADPNGFLAQIAEYLLAPAVTPDPDTPNGRHHWAFATLKYFVE